MHPSLWHSPDRCIIHSYTFEGGCFNPIIEFGGYSVFIIIMGQVLAFVAASAYHQYEKNNFDFEVHVEGWWFILIVFGFMVRQFSKQTDWVQPAYANG